MSWLHKILVLEDHWIHMFNNRYSFCIVYIPIGTYSERRINSIFRLTFFSMWKTKWTYSLEHFMLLFGTMSVDEQDVWLLLPSVVYFMSFYRLNSMLEAPFIHHILAIFFLFFYCLLINSSFNRFWFFLLATNHHYYRHQFIKKKEHIHICIRMVYTHVHRLKISTKIYSLWCLNVVFSCDKTYSQASAWCRLNEWLIIVLSFTVLN